MALGWIIHGRKGVLGGNGLSCWIDLDTPNRGLQEVLLEGKLISTQLLAASLGGESCEEEMDFTESYIRAGDLVCQYETPDRFTKLTCYWKARQDGSGTTTLDLVASVHTERGESTPFVRTESVYLQASGKEWTTANRTIANLKSSAVVVSFDSGTPLVVEESPD